MTFSNRHALLIAENKRRETTNYINTNPKKLKWSHRYQTKYTSRQNGDEDERLI